MQRARAITSCIVLSTPSVPGYSHIQAHRINRRHGLDAVDGLQPSALAGRCANPGASSRHGQGSRHLASMRSHPPGPQVMMAIATPCIAAAGGAPAALCEFRPSV
jgi:hypothetical protein